MSYTFFHSSLNTRVRTACILGISNCAATLYILTEIINLGQK